MRRTICTLAMIAAVTATSPPVSARTPVTGTISCTATGELPFGPPYLPTAGAEPLTRYLRLGGRSDISPCDGSGVTGGNLEIIAVDARFNGKLAPGTDCASFLGTLSLTGKVKLRWLASKNGFYTTVGTSGAKVASAVYDSGTVSWVVTTTPIKTGAFAGSTLTMHFSLYDEASYAHQCETSDFRYAGWSFGPQNPWLIDIP